MIEKKGVIDEDTPQPARRGCRCCERQRAAAGEPTTKQAADELASHLANDLTDAVVAQSKPQD